MTYTSRSNDIRGVLNRIDESFQHKELNPRGKSQKLIEGIKDAMVKIHDEILSHRYSINKLKEAFIFNKKKIKQLREMTSMDDVEDDDKEESNSDNEPDYQKLAKLAVSQPMPKPSYVGNPSKQVIDKVFDRK